MESRRLSSPRLPPDESDFLSRYVNLEWDAEGSEWNDEFPDIQSNEFFSREHSHDKFFEDEKNSRKSSLEKPVGFLMQLKPRAAFVCENFKSSSWGKFLKSERKHLETSQGYLKENTDCNNNNNKVNIEKAEDKNNGRQSQCHSVASVAVHNVLEGSPGEVEHEQQQQQSLKKERKEQNTCGSKEASNRFSKQFSVYSQSFELNTRFLSKSHYHISHWKPEKSRVKTREHTTNRKNPILDVAAEKRMACKKDDIEKATGVEAIRRKFNTDKYHRSWAWEPKDSPSTKPKVSGKTNQKAQDSNTHSSKKYCSTEVASRKTRFQRISKEKNKISGPFRQLSENNTARSSGISLPAISSQNISVVSRQRSPHKLGHFPCISTDNLTKQYKKYHDEFIKQKNKTNKNNQIYT